MKEELDISYTDLEFFEYDEFKYGFGVTPAPAPAPAAAAAAAPAAAPATTPASVQDDWEPEGFKNINIRSDFGFGG